MVVSIAVPALHNTRMPCYAKYCKPPCFSDRRRIGSRCRRGSRSRSVRSRVRPPRTHRGHEQKGLLSGSLFVEAFLTCNQRGLCPMIFPARVGFPTALAYLVKWMESDGPQVTACTNPSSLIAFLVVLTSVIANSTTFFVPPFGVLLILWLGVVRPLAS